MFRDLRNLRIQVESWEVDRAILIYAENANALSDRQITQLAGRNLAYRQ